MAHRVDVERVKEALVQAVKDGDEARARELVAMLGFGARQVRGVLEAMLEEPDALVKQAAAFGLGELAGTASARRLEQQLAIEEARGNYDGESVAEEIVRALSRIKSTGARASLVRKLERLAGRKPTRSDVYELASALWRQRHPDLIPVVRRSLEQIPLPAPHGMHGLLVLLEKSPEELGTWMRDPSVPVEFKSRVLTVVQEDVPDMLVPVLPAFIFAAQDLCGRLKGHDAAAESYCDSLSSLLLFDRERFVVSQPGEVREALRHVARELISATFPNPSIRAAVVLGLVGGAEDTAFLQAHAPADAAGAKVFHEAARRLANLQ